MNMKHDAGRRTPDAGRKGPAVRSCELRTRRFELRKLLRDETAATATEYVVATLAVALGAIAGSVAIAGALISYLHRIYLVVTLPIP
jgi:Flp pilus assembly pilin Flp